MRMTSWWAAFAVVVASFVACGSPGTTAGPQPQAAGLALTAPSTISVSSTASAGPGVRLVTMMDACDGPTFNLAVGPGTCSRGAGVNFSEFVTQLTAHQSVGAWHNAPSQTDASLGDALTAVNNGGEVHTFTRVANFGGGIVPFLNTLAGTPIEAPECASEGTFVLPGGTDSETLNQEGTLKFQCCIHPWMRTTVLVKSH